MTYNSSNGKLTAEVNMYIAKKDLTDVYSNVIYLGIYDSQDNYIEVNETERDEINRKKEEAQQALYLDSVENKE